MHYVLGVDNDFQSIIRCNFMAAGLVPYYLFPPKYQAIQGPVSSLILLELA